MRVDYVLKDERVDPVGEAIDLTFRLGPMEDSRLTARRLGAYGRRLVASPEFVARHGRTETPQQLNDAPTLDFTGLGYGRRWPLSDGRRAVTVEIKGETRANSGEALLDLTLQGLGVALLPAFLVDPLLADDRLVRILPDWSGPALELHAIWAARELPRKARAFLDFIIPRLSVER